MKLRLLGIAAITLLLTQAAVAQMSGDLDTSFHAAARTNGSIIVQADGKILLGGDGTGYGPKRLLPDGSLDATFNASVWNITKLIDHPDGNIYGFGPGAIRYSQTGTENLPLASRIESFTYNGGTFGSIKDVALRTDGSMIAVGKFDEVHQGTGGGYFLANCILKLGADLAVDFTFKSNNGTGFNGEVVSVSIDEANDKIYCVGYFTSFDNNFASGICRLNGDGTFDNTFNSGTGFNLGANEFPSKVLVLSDGRIFLGGAFLTYNGVTKNGSVILNADGSLEASYNENYYGVTAVVELENGNLLIAINQSYRLFEVALSSNYEYTNFNNNYRNQGGATGGYVYSITQLETGKYIIGGTFTDVHGSSHNGLAQLYVCERVLDKTVDFSNGVLTANATASSYLWYGEDAMTEEALVLSNNTSQTFTPTQPGYYYVILTDGECQTKSQWVNLTTLSVAEEKISTISVYPNPANSNFTINGLEANSEVFITDQSGRKIESFKSTQSNLNIDASKFAKGLYFIRMTSAQGSIQVEKIIIQ